MGVGYSVRFLEGWAPVMGSGHSVGLPRDRTRAKLGAERTATPFS